MRRVQPILSTVKRGGKTCGAGIRRLNDEKACADSNVARQLHDPAHDARADGMASLRSRWLGRFRVWGVGCGVWWGGACCSSPPCPVASIVQCLQASTPMTTKTPTLSGMAHAQRRAFLRQLRADRIGAAAAGS